MRNKGQEQVWDLMGEEVDIQNWEKRAIKQDAVKFEQIIRETRIRLGLEVSHV